MIELIDFQQGNTIGLKAKGKISKEDYDKINTYTKTQLEEYDKINFYIEIESLEGMSPEAIYEDLKFSLNHLADVDKEAIVTEINWIQNIAKAADKITPDIDVKVFAHDEKKKARNWLLE